MSMVFFKKSPRKYSLFDLRSVFAPITDWPLKKSVDGDYWVPARPLNAATLKERFKLAWGVFKGELDALEWPK